jgi:hypothetical protein
MTIFDCILQTIFQLEDIDESNQADFLLQLRPFARELWSGYRSDQISIDYSNIGLQYAYLIRYFPFYMCLLNDLLESSDRPYNRSKSEDLVATFFGGGPGPEILGLLSHLDNKNCLQGDITTNIVDLHSESWQRIRGALFQSVKDAEATFLKNSLEVNNLSIDLSREDQVTTPPLIDALKKSEFVMFQYCLNEISSPTYINNVASALENCETGTNLVIIEASNYPVDNLNALLNQVGESWILEVVASQEFCCYGVLAQCPPIITDNLLCPPREDRSWSNQLTYPGKVKYHGVLGVRK